MKKVHKINFSFALINISFVFLFIVSLPYQLFAGAGDKLVIPAGTSVKIKSLHQINNKYLTSTGKQFDYIVSENVYVDGQVAIMEGSIVVGLVRPLSIGNSGSISIYFDHVKAIDSSNIELTDNNITVTGLNKKKAGVAVGTVPIGSIYQCKVAYAVSVRNIYKDNNNAINNSPGEFKPNNTEHGAPAYPSTATYQATGTFGDSKGLALSNLNKPDAIKGNGKYYALLIAAQDYQDKEIQSLEYPISDSKRFSEVLKKSYAFDSIRVLKNPSKSDIMRVIYAYRNSLQDKDNFLLFYSGHGYWDKESEQGYWFPVNADVKDPSTWISNSDIKDEIKAMKCLHTLLVSDACFSGGIFKTRDLQLNGASRTVQELYKIKSRKAMTSGAMTEVPDKSAFLKYMIEALEDNSNTYISAEKLFASFKENAINNSKMSGLIPQFGVIADTDDKGGDFIFIRR